MTWNLGLDFLLRVAQVIGGTGVEKPVAGFADDVTLYATDRIVLRALVRAAEHLCNWAGLRFKV